VYYYRILSKPRQNQIKVISDKSCAVYLPQVSQIIQSDFKINVNSFLN
jgi:hypothetical protein